LVEPIRNWNLLAPFGIIKPAIAIDQA